MKLAEFQRITLPDSCWQDVYSLWKGLPCMLGPLLQSVDATRTSRQDFFDG